jgi:endonuclease/exonuclease/phosphatase family metal-dependent hydrolase
MPKTKLTISTINLQSGVAAIGGVFTYPFYMWKYWLPHSTKSIYDAGKMLDREDVDIACITEISERSLRTSFNSQTEILTHSAGLPHAYFFSAQKRGKFFFYEGITLATKYPITNPNSHILHNGLTRTALKEAKVVIRGRQITVFIVHLSLIKRIREIQMKEIIEIIQKQKGPIIFAGVFNERDPEFFTELMKKTSLKHKCSLKTFPSWNPRYNFDCIFLSEDFTVLDCYIPEGKLFSDHAPLVVKAELG